MQLRGSGNLQDGTGGSYPKDNGTAALEISKATVMQKRNGISSHLTICVWSSDKYMGNYVHKNEAILILEEPKYCIEKKIMCLYRTTWLYCGQYCVVLRHFSHV